MRLLALDPSSTRTGWAIFDDGKLAACGFFRTRPKDSPLVRIESQLNDLASLLVRPLPDHIVVEVTSGKVARNHKGHGAGLAVYGMAVGAFWVAARNYRPDGICVHAVCENEWTRAVPKPLRMKRIAGRYPAYAARQHEDPGGDVADAIGIGEYWLANNCLDRGAR